VVRRARSPSLSGILRFPEPDGTIAVAQESVRQSGQNVYRGFSYRVIEISKHKSYTPPPLPTPDPLSSKPNQQISFRRFFFLLPQQICPGLKHFHSQMVSCGNSRPANSCFLVKMQPITLKSDERHSDGNSTRTLCK
jgi:hypothetical protein